MFNTLKNLLDANAAQYRVIEHPAEGGSIKVAEIRGTEVGRGAKAMLCQQKGVDAPLILAVLPGDQRIDFKKVAAVVGATKVSLASPERAMEVTGCVMGAVPPFTFSDEVILLMDESLLKRYDEIAFNAGRLDRSIVLNAQDYLRIAQPKLVTIIL